MLLSAILMLPAAVETCPKWCSSWQCDGSMWCSSGKIPAPCRKRCQQEGSSADVPDLLSHRLDTAIMLANQAPTAAKPTFSPPKHCQTFVFMSFGRSGTTAIANAVEALTSSTGTELHFELMGGNRDAMGQVDDPVLTASSYLSSSGGSAHRTRQLVSLVSNSSRLSKLVLQDSSRKASGLT